LVRIKRTFEESHCGLHAYVNYLREDGTIEWTTRDRNQACARIERKGQWRVVPGLRLGRPRKDGSTARYTRPLESWRSGNDHIAKIER
jgi:hypothetical protein